jgi:hypothetical protein
LNKYFLLVILAGLMALQAKAQDAVSSDLEEVNVYESLKKSGDAPANSAPDVKMSTLEEQDDLQSLKEDIGDVVFEKDKKTAADKKTETKTEVKTETETAKAPAEETKKGPLDVVNPKGQTLESMASDKTEIIPDKDAGFDVGS